MVPAPHFRHNAKPASHFGQNKKWFRGCLIRLRWGGQVSAGTISAPPLVGHARPTRSLQRPTRLLDFRQQSTAADEPLDRLQVAVQRAVAAERADVLAEVPVR